MPEFFERIYENLFLPKFDTYEYVTAFNNTLSFQIIVWAFYIGLLAAVVSIYYNRSILGRFIRRLDELGCCDAETAKTLSELGLDKNIFIKLSLKLGYSLRRTTAVVRDGVVSPLIGAEGGKVRLSLKTARFCLPAEKHDAALMRFAAKGNGILSIALTAVIGLIAVILIFRFMPELAAVLDGLAKDFSGNAPIV